LSPSIGDAYVVAGGFPFVTNDPKLTAADHAERVLKMACEMHIAIKRIKNAENGSIEMRIGLHTGEIVAGVIGTKQLRYDIWGVDSIVANTMESSGVPSGITVSGSTAKYCVLLTLLSFFCPRFLSFRFLFSIHSFLVFFLLCLSLLFSLPSFSFPSSFLRLLEGKYPLLLGPTVYVKGKGDVQIYTVKAVKDYPDLVLKTEFLAEHEAHGGLQVCRCAVVCCFIVSLIFPVCFPLCFSGPYCFLLVLFVFPLVLVLVLVLGDRFERTQRTG
jgi:hypothetical protein